MGRGHHVPRKPWAVIASDPEVSPSYVGSNVLQIAVDRVAPLALIYLPYHRTEEQCCATSVCI